MGTKPDNPASTSTRPIESSDPDQVKDTVEVSVVIPSYQREAQLLRTLGKIGECSPGPREVLIHLDGGWDFPLEERARDLHLPLTVFRSSQRLGPGGGRDLMIRKAHCEYVASFDDDSFPATGDFFAKVIRIFDAVPNAAVVGAQISNPSSPKQSLHFDARITREFTGCGVVYRKSVYLTSLGYVPLPVAYSMEEADLALQLRCLGHRILFTPALSVIHQSGIREANWPEINATTIKNQALLPFLRYPVLLWPLGFLQWIRRIFWHITQGRLSGLASGVVGIPAYLWKYRSYRHPFPIGQVWNYLMFRFTAKNQLDDPVIQTLDGPSRAPSNRRILYLQFTNPCAYPPLEHGSRLLADEGWDVTFLGTGGFGAKDLDFSPHPRITVLRRKFYRGGLRQKLEYLLYCLWVLRWLKRENPAWIYCSDPFSSIPGRLAKKFGRARIVYHEHDSPDPEAESTLFSRYILSQRLALAGEADIVILPNQERLEFLLEQAPTRGKSFCVWNCPTVEEVAAPKPLPAGDNLHLVYHGTLVPDRLPMSLLDAMKSIPTPVFLSLAGYSTIGHKDYLAEFFERAEELGIRDRVSYAGTIPERADLLKHAGENDVGLSLMPVGSGDINARQMLGASNKPFDYLSQGLPMLISCLPEWEEMFVDSGMGLSCDPRDARSITAALNKFAQDPKGRREMGERGRRMIQEKWNYEEQFAPVFTELHTDPSAP